jgi:ABC-type multidrug transport system fused ATPase/permease subunit
MKNIDHFGPATLMTRLTNDVTRIQTFVNGMMRMMLKAPLVGLGSLIMAVNLNPELSIILLAVVPVIALLIFMNMKISYPLFRKVQRTIDAVNQALQEYLTGVRVVKIFNRSAYEVKKFQIKNTHLGQSCNQCRRRTYGQTDSRTYPERITKNDVSDMRSANRIDHGCRPDHRPGFREDFSYRHASPAAGTLPLLPGNERGTAGKGGGRRW